MSKDVVSNIKKIKLLMKKYNKSLWILLKADIIFNKYISDEIVSPSITFISKNKVFILIHDLDKYNIFNNINLNENNIYIITYSNFEERDKKIEMILKDYSFKYNISFSYSTIADEDVDNVSYGELIEFTKLISRVYSKYNKKFKISSAENIMYELLAEKTTLDIERIRLAENITHDILEYMFKNIKVGDSEIDIYNYILSLTEKYDYDSLNKGITKVMLSWKNCPYVLFGPNIAKSGHTLPSDYRLNYGDTVYVDFGICLEFEDGMHACSDIQRMGYVLKENDRFIPKKILKVFNTLKNSINGCLDYMKPGALGYEIDNIARKVILNNGYPNYNHASGHPVGFKVHDVGSIIGKKSHKRSFLPLVENCIYTLEPRVQIENGGSIEEMFLVTKYGAVPLGKEQDKIYVIK